MNKLTFENAIYCYVRYLLWGILIGILIGLSTSIAIFIMWKFLAVLFDLSGIFADMLKLAEKPFDFPIVYIIFNVIPTFLAVKFSLKKVFFKPYKHFSIKPKFAKVPIQLVMLITTIICLYNLLFALLPEAKHNLPSIMAGEFLIAVCMEFFVLKYIIGKNSADIVVRIEK